MKQVFINSVGDVTIKIILERLDDGSFHIKVKCLNELFYTLEQANIFFLSVRFIVWDLMKNTNYLKEDYLINIYKNYIDCSTEFFAK